ncbi:hypothetical protein BBK82_29935 [Lentzea guizhouensis]|uniref:Uncharacterized protein n=1 Tax=Lentzea guizhouensis TaxID=1586287 RepID=A0A1B2HPJ6_9PSEU|nr:hypothetical protein BBK82_29935 [Lentzea guizhouensis]
MTLALNVADPLLSGGCGKAAFDAVGPMLLIGWAEVGPGMIPADLATVPVPRWEDRGKRVDEYVHGLTGAGLEDLDRARQADARHWAAHKRPISADALRIELKVSMERAREFMSAVRGELTELVVTRADGGLRGVRVSA